MLWIHTGPQFLHEKPSSPMVWDKAKNFGVVQWKKRRSNEMLFVRVIHKKLIRKKALLNLNPLTRNKLRKIKTIVFMKVYVYFYFICEEGKVLKAYLAEVLFWIFKF